jgi:hypothetical protein
MAGVVIKRVTGDSQYSVYDGVLVVIIMSDETITSNKMAELRVRDNFLYQ